MADLGRIKRDIADIASGPKSVRFQEIQRIVRQLGLAGWSVDSHKGKEAWIFWVQGETFTVSEHNPGNSQLKSCYVHNFLRAMINLGLYED